MSHNEIRASLKLKCCSGHLATVPTNESHFLHKSSRVPLDQCRWEAFLELYRTPRPRIPHAVALSVASVGGVTHRHELTPLAGEATSFSDFCQFVGSSNHPPRHALTHHLLAGPEHRTRHLDVDFRDVVIGPGTLTFQGRHALTPSYFVAFWSPRIDPRTLSIEHFPRALRPSDSVMPIVIKWQKPTGGSGPDLPPRPPRDRRMEPEDRAEPNTIDIEEIYEILKELPPEKLKRLREKLEGYEGLQ